MTLLVGKDEFPFRVHKDLLLKCGSNFFVACLNNFSEAQTNTIRLPDDDKFPIRVFIEWLYSRKFDYLGLGGGYPRYPKDLSKIVLFGDKVGAEAFLNELMDEMMRAFFKANTRSIPADFVPLLRSGLRDSPFYQFGITSFAHNVTLYHSEEEVERIKHSVKDLNGSPEAVEDIFSSILDYGRKRGRGDPSGWNGCHFHQHQEGSECAAMKK